MSSNTQKNQQKSIEDCRLELVRAANAIHFLQESLYSIVMETPVVTPTEQVDAIAFSLGLIQKNLEQTCHWLEAIDRNG
jgi:hypothetical protein